MGTGEGKLEPREVEGQQSLVSQKPEEAIPGGNVCGMGERGLQRIRRHLARRDCGDRCWLGGVVRAAGSTVIGDNRKNR